MTLLTGASALRRTSHRGTETQRKLFDRVDRTALCRQLGVMNDALHARLLSRADQPSMIKSLLCAPVSLWLVRRCCFFGIVLLAMQPGTVAAQSAGNQMAEVDPIRCWWRTSDGAVGVGQPFTLVLTCAVLETAAVRVVPDEGPLAVGSVQLAPFELVGGDHPADLRSGQRRFFQYRVPASHHRPERDRPRRRVPADR